MTPMVIGLVLGKLCESNLRRALIVSKGSWATFLPPHQPVLYSSVAVYVVLPLY